MPNLPTVRRQPRRMSMLEAMVIAGDDLRDRTRPLPAYIETHLESSISDLLHLWLADADPSFYGHLMHMEL